MVVLEFFLNFPSSKVLGQISYMLRNTCKHTCLGYKSWVLNQYFFRRLEVFLYSVYSLDTKYQMV